MALRLAREEGLFAGTSTGGNVVAALRLAELLAVYTILSAPSRRPDFFGRRGRTAKAWWLDVCVAGSS